MPENSDINLLYLFSDLAYVAKLKAGKKAHEFIVSDFLQVNGQFLDDNQLIEKHVEKLLGKLEAGTYHLILPDFLFTNTIINAEVKDEAAVKEYLTSKFLPDLKITQDDFYINTSILSNYNGVFKVQLSALEKTIVSPLAKALKKYDQIKIDKIAPLSFSAKALISLEPSVAILQMGRELFLAQLYIGMEQCFNTTIDQAEDFAETVKTLKGVEPSLQTVYLLSDALVDDKIKTALKETLPVQQLADIADENSKLPSHVKKIIEAAAKTFAIPEYLLPQFSLDEKYEAPAIVGEDELTKKSKSKDEEKKSEQTSSKEEQAPKTETALNDQATEEKPVEEKPVEEQAEDKKSEPPVSETLPAPSKLDLAAVNEVKETVENTKAADSLASKETETKPESKETTAADSKTDSTPAEIDLAQFANLAVDPAVLGKKTDPQPNHKEVEMKTELTPKKVIKNKSEAGGMLKMIAVAILAFVITIALGVGIGFGYLHISNKADQPAEIETPAVTPAPIAEETPEPTQEPVVIDKTEYQLKVVNATTQAGYAGDMATALEEAGFDDVVAANAKGDYDSVNYLLLASLEADQEATNQALLQEVETATGLTYQLSDQSSVEDSSGDYQAVLVLGE